MSESRRSMLRKIYETVTGNRAVTQPSDRKRKKKPKHVRRQRRVQVAPALLAAERAAHRTGGSRKDAAGTLIPRATFRRMPTAAQRAWRLSQRQRGMGRPGKVFR